MSATYSSKLRIYLFDSFRVEVDGVEIATESWKSKKAITILKYLAHNHGKKVSGEVLKELLWPEDNRVDKAGCLHTAVWWVRKSLAPNVRSGGRSLVRFASGMYWLDLADDAFVDTKEFEVHIAEAKRLEMADPDAAVSHYKAALELYTNDFLSEDLYEEWTIPCRDYYRELYFRAACRLANMLIDLYQDYREAAGICNEALRKDHTREEFYQAIIRALGGDHRYAEAVSYYRQCCQMLLREFQLDPNPYTQAIMKEIRQKMAASKHIIELDAVDTQSWGAYACDRTVFRTVLRLEERRLERGGRGFSLVVMSCDGLETRMLNQFRNAFTIAQSSLRKSDLICHWSPSVVLILLSDIDTNGAKVVVRKLRQEIEKRLTSTHIQFEILSSEHLDRMKERLLAVLA